MRINEKGQFIKQPLAERFWPKFYEVQLIHGDGCWMWLGNKSKFGYGLIKDSNTHRQLRAHRVSWELHNGAIPKGMNVLHHCDNPSCVNPRHLHLGTHADNHKDRIAHGKRMTGENNGMAKLTAETVAEIRSSFVPRGKGWKKGKKKGDWTNEGSPKWLAQKYDISIAHVQRIITGDRW